MEGNGLFDISTPMPTTNLRFHSFNPVTLPELIQQWKADYTKAWERFCPIPEYLYFFLTKASSYKPEPYVIADLFLCGIAIHFIDFYPFLMKGDRVKMRIQLLPLVNHKELVLMFFSWCNFQCHLKLTYEGIKICSEGSHVSL